MNCPHCGSSNTVPRQRTTNQGYSVHRCRDCGKTFNERTGTPFNFIEVPTDILFEVLLCRVRYKMSYRDVAEYFLMNWLRVFPLDEICLKAPIYLDSKDYR
jgi:transposase-like protein